MDTSLLCPYLLTLIALYAGRLPLYFFPIYFQGQYPIEVPLNMRNIVFLRLCPVVVLILFMFSSLQARTWTDTNGRKLNASFISVTSTHVNLKLESGKEVSVPLSQLCEEDGEYIRSGQFLSDLDAASSSPSSEDAAPSNSASSGKKIQQILQDHVDMDFTQLPLIDVIEGIKANHHLDIQLDKNSLADAYIDPVDLTVDVTLKGITLASALDYILRSYNLTYAAKGNTLFITTVGHLLDNPDSYTKYYPYQFPSIRASAQTIRQKLKSIVSIDFKQLPLKDAIEKLNRSNDILILLDNLALTNAMLDPEDLTVDKSAKNIALETALASILRDIGLTYIVWGEYVLITTPDIALKYNEEFDFAKDALNNNVKPNSAYGVTDKSGQNSPLSTSPPAFSSAIRRPVVTSPPLVTNPSTVTRQPTVTIIDTEDDEDGSKVVTVAPEPRSGSYTRTVPPLDRTSSGSSFSNSSTYRPNSLNLQNDNADWIPPQGSISESVVYDLLKNTDVGSLVAYEKLMSIRDEDSTLFEPDYSIALLYIFKRRDLSQAKKHFLRCSKCSPEDPGVLANLGTICILQKKYLEGYNYYKKAVHLNPKSSALAHNIGKLLFQYGKGQVNITKQIATNFIHLGEETTPKSDEAFDNRKGWRFVPCSEGYSKESEKMAFFALPDFPPYEFPLCLTCFGSGRIECPNNACSGGKVGYNAKVRRTFPNGDSVYVSERRTAECKVCKGTGKLKCPICGGTGCEFTPKYNYRSSGSSRYSNSDDSPGYNYSHSNDD